MNQINKTAICNTAIAPMRKEASDSSEMVSQLLFGESLEVTEIRDNWSHIKLLSDNYMGWIDSKQISVIATDILDNLLKRSQIITEREIKITDKNNFIVHLPFGSVVSESFIQLLHYKPINDFNSFKITQENWLQKIIEVYINTPYLWGGKSPYGIDCSGLTQMAFRVLGIELPRDAWQQAEKNGEEITDLSITQPGDLAFFENKDHKITHVGIILDDLRIIHASGKVRIDKLCQEGIINTDTGELSHKLSLVKRFNYISV